MLISINTAAADFSSGRLDFTVRIKGDVCPYQVFGVYVLPNEPVAIEVVDVGKHGGFVLDSKAGSVTSLGDRKWEWTAPPEAGLYPVIVRASEPDGSMVLNVFVMVPIEKVQNGYLDGYRIGEYPSVPLKQLPIYKPPRGFIKVTKENRLTKISPHFELGRFVAKQKSDYPKFVVLREGLLLKLELVLEKTNEAGYSCGTFHIMSGYRTPFYNKAIGNVKYSRHVWGGAADFFIDEKPKDGVMDDLNKDGVINYKDAAIIYDIVDGMFGKTWYQPFVGGLGRYKKTASHGPFVHIDVRGTRARWGK